MTVDELIEPARFLLPARPSYYAAKIVCKHWQLRSLLCSPAPNIIYYPSHNNIYCLNTLSQKRTLVATLPFSPRCIGTRYGWVCAGGQNDGRIATIRINDDGTPLCPSDGLDEPRHVRSATVKKLGGSIVNSVTLHRPPSSRSEEDVLAVLTNNDKTVRIFHLAKNRLVTTLHAEVSTNHASISPDGQHLVVVGDSRKVYFYHPSACDGIGEPGCADSWILSSHPPLTAGPEKDTLMSTSFSPSSLHCAIASQSGKITIFDTRYIDSNRYPNGPSPLVKELWSSRPHSEAGAVRNILFSPSPWDLLIWTEHCGRVCVVDSRTYKRRQVIDIPSTRRREGERDNEAFEEIMVTDSNDLPSAWDLSQSLYGPPTTNRRSEEAESSRASRISPTEVSRARFLEAASQDDLDAGDDEHAYADHNIEELSRLLLENPDEWVPYTTRIRYATPGPDYPRGTPQLLLDYRERMIERERARQGITGDVPRRRNSVHPSYGGEDSSSRYHGDDGWDRDRGLSEQLLGLLESQRRRTRRERLEVENGSGVYRGEGVDVDGCCVSADGKWLWVATDEGVLGYGVDCLGRRLFPSVVPR